MTAVQRDAALPQAATAGAAVARVLPFAVFIGIMALEHLLKSLAPALDLRWMYALRAGAALLAMAAFARAYVELADFGAVTARAWTRGAFVGAAVFVVWIAVDQPWAGGGAGPGFDATAGDGRIDWALVSLRFAGSVAVVPLMEELFWRSFILRWIARRDFLHQAPATAGLRALLVSSLLFGIEHELWLAGIVAGLAYGGLYMRGGSLWPVVAAHATTNLLLGVWVVGMGEWRLW